MGGDASPPVNPKLAVSDKVSTGSIRRSVANKRRPGSRPAAHAPRPGSLAQRCDINDSPSTSKRNPKQSAQRRERSPRPASGKSTGGRSSETELAQLFSRLSPNPEGNGPTTNVRPTNRGSDSKYCREGAIRRRRPNNNGSSVYSRPVRQRTVGAQKRNESLFKNNPSLLSVLTTLTIKSDQSSGSNSTVTQQSYDRRSSDSSKTLPPMAGPMPPDAEVESTVSSPAETPNVFDYMVASSEDSEPDDNSARSSSPSSHYEPSVAGSSEAPDTPSSRSTFPSPTRTRSHSVAELRKKYDPQYAASGSSAQSSSSSSSSSSHSPQSGTYSARKQPSVSDVLEDEEEEHLAESTAPSQTRPDHPEQPSARSPSRSSSRSSAGTSSHSSSYSSSRSRPHSRPHSTDRLQHQEEIMRQHMAYANQAQHAHYIDPAYGQHRSPSASSAYSDRAPYAYNMAMQQYQWPPPPPAMSSSVLPQPVDTHIARPGPPPAPDAPDPGQRTVAGYEMLAMELASNDSPVQPLYRRFVYLNNRILLHIQDELCELEEQLRSADEMIAQMDPALAQGLHVPASRRGEAYSGTDIHHRRTSLLGRIFMKMEQYNKALSVYKSMMKDVHPADAEQIQEYQKWMAKHAPVHEVEARFLQHHEDLMVPGEAKTAVDRPIRHASPPIERVDVAHLAVALMLPLLLASIIPSLAGRLAVEALTIAVAVTATLTTRIRYLLSPQEWALNGAAYILLMAVIAACTPHHTT